MTESLASLDDLAVRIPGGSIAVVEQPRALAALEDASALVVDVAGTDFLDGATPSVPASVLAVVCNAARRVLDNPYGRANESQGNASWSNSATSGVFLTDQERQVIRRAVGTSDWVSIAPSHLYRLDGTDRTPTDATDVGWSS